MELPPYVDDPAVYVTVGVGLPAIAHAEVGFLPHPRLGVELRGSWVIFNPMVGLAVDGAVWTSTGGARGHAFTATAELLVNPTLTPFTLVSHGETLGGTLGVYAGYRWMADSGFTVRAQVGGFGYLAFTGHDAGFALGPNATIGVGWAF